MFCGYDKSIKPYNMQGICVLFLSLYSLAITNVVKINSSAILVLKAGINIFVPIYL